MGRAVKPGVPFSTMNALTPARPLVRSVRAKITPHSPRSAREMKIFVPFSTQWSPCLTAVVWMAPAGSEPPLGSVMAKNVW